MKKAGVARGSAQSETSEREHESRRFRPSGMKEKKGDRPRGTEEWMRGWVRVDADIAVGQVRFCLNGESGYRMIHIVPTTFRAPFQPFSRRPLRALTREYRTNLGGSAEEREREKRSGGGLSPSCQKGRRRDSVKAKGGGPFGGSN